MRRPRLPLEHLIRVTREAFTAARQDPGCDPRCHDVRLAHLLEIERQVISRLKRPRARKARLLGESIMRMSLQSVASSRRADKPLRVLMKRVVSAMVPPREAAGCHDSARLRSAKVASHFPRPRDLQRLSWDPTRPPLPPGRALGVIPSSMCLASAREGQS